LHVFRHHRASYDFSAFLFALISKSPREKAQNLAFAHLLRDACSGNGYCRDTEVGKSGCKQGHATAEQCALKLIVELRNFAAATALSAVARAR
jgi:hypothetical protein